MTEEKLSLKDTIKINLRGIGLIYSLVPGNLFMTVLFILADVIYSYWDYFFLAKLVNDVASGSAREVLVWDVVFVTIGKTLVMYVFKLLQMFYFYAGSNSWELANAHLNEKMMCMDYEYMESESIHNRRRDIDTMARYNGGGICLLFWLATPVVEKGLQMLIAFCYMVYLVSRSFVAFPGNPMMAAAFVGSFAAAFAILLTISAKKNKMAQEKMCQYNEANVPHYRQFQFYSTEYIEKEECGKTIRMFHQQKLLTGHFDRLMERVYDNLDGLFRENLKKNIWVGAVEALVSGLVYFLLAVMVSRKAVSIGSICLYAGCITNFLFHFRWWMEQWVLLSENTRYVKNYLDFLEIPNKKYEGTLPVEKRDDDQFYIEFCHVSFRYPGSDQDVLKDFSIRFRIGERLAVVGKNGSGKTTFIKLLCRLYDPTEGEIRLNGIDIRKFDYQEYLSLFSVVFQDFKIPALPLGEVVAVSTQYDSVKVEDVLERVGLRPLLSKLPDGLETPLYTDFDQNGVEISGGEAQKVAIARALYHDTPFVILDEPTAALDPLAEYEIYSHFDDLVGSKTAVYISHRLSSCQFCNDILVIDEGKAVQRGSHADLVQDKAGLYYTLWNTQAQYYQEKERIS